MTTHSLCHPGGQFMGHKSHIFQKTPELNQQWPQNALGPLLAHRKLKKKAKRGTTFKPMGGYPFLAPLISHNSKAPISAPQVGHKRGTQKPTAANPKPKRGLTHYGFMLGFFGLSCF